MKYVDLVIENRSDKTDRPYTYIYNGDDIKIGSVVYVPFNRGNKIKKAYVIAVNDEKPENKSGKEIKYKEVESVDEKIALTDEIIHTALWISRRYYCRTIDAINLFAPTVTALKSEKPGETEPSQAEDDSGIVPTLTNEQQYAMGKIDKAIDENLLSLFLLHGITGSGKTEVYIRAVDKCIANGRNAIVMVPEISLTNQMVDRFIARFGAENVAVLHSKMSKGQRYRQWSRIRNGEVRIAIGARSAVFAPFENIGIIIMDEEHETSYKSDMTPKYDTVEVASKRLTNQVVPGTLLLGSATPSVVTNFRAGCGIFTKLSLTKRYNEVKLPKIQIVDMREEMKRGNQGIFSKALYEKLEATMDSGKQAILFLNRRGYSTYISCCDCGYVLKCADCDISLTYHKHSNSALCHYCGRRTPPPAKCPECGSEHMGYFGIGTEKLTEEVEKLFPECVVARLDLDTTQKKGSVERILKSYENQKTDILVGTQLVAKGLDFKNVALVGIVSADVSLNIPDYRAAERTFQLITQAAGRAGRGTERGDVIVQTYTPHNYAIMAAVNADYDTFYNAEIVLRKMRTYPPFSDIIKVEFSGKNDSEVYRVAKTGENLLKEILNEAAHSVLPVQSSYIAKIGDRYQYSFLVKAQASDKVKYANAVLAMKKNLTAIYHNVNIGIDINPY